MGPEPDIGASRRLLVVAYYFPPMGLSGVQRISKFVKYLPEFGWQPTVLTVVPGGYFAFDPSLEEDLKGRHIEVERTVSLDPTRLFGRRNLVSLPAEGVRSAFGAISQFFFVPDNKIGWYASAVRKGMSLLRERRFHAIVSSAPPYTAHLIGASLKRRTGLPLVLDFRDDWVGNPRHVYPTRAHLAIHRRLERRTLASADYIVAINEHILNALRARNTAIAGPERTAVLTQGFDPEDFPGPVEPVAAAHFVLLYTGIFYDAQKPDSLFRAVARLRQTDPEIAGQLRLQFVGMLPDNARVLADSLGIAPQIDFRGYLSHAETVVHMKAATALWMVVGRRRGAEGISTGKLFEYFGSRKPILGLVPEGEARRTLEDYGAAFLSDPDDEVAIGDCIRTLFSAWKAGTLPRPSEDFVRRYDRRLLTGALAHICENLQVVHAT